METKVNDPWFDAVTRFFSTGGKKPHLFIKNERDGCPLPIYLSYDGEGNLCFQLKSIENENQILHLNYHPFQVQLNTILKDHTFKWDQKGITKRDRGIFGIYYEGPNHSPTKREWAIQMYPLFLEAAKHITGIT